MQIILRKDVKHLGLAGDVVSVKAGYARHFLLPKKWAIPFTKARASELTHRKQWIAVQQKKAQKQRQTWMEKVKGLQLSFVREADSSGHLFGSVSPSDIVKELGKQGYEVDKKWVSLEQPLKKTGEHPITLSIGADMTSEITVLISPAIRKTKEARGKKPKSASSKKENEEKSTTGETITPSDKAEKSGETDPG